MGLLFLGFRVLGVQSFRVSRFSVSFIAANPSALELEQGSWDCYRSGRQGACLDPAVLCLFGVALIKKSPDQYTVAS